VSKISAFIICSNEEDKIERCLAALSFCDEIIIIDSGSSDKTLDICRRYTNNIFHNTWLGFVEQKSFGLSKCNHEWALNLDADEVVSPELAQEIKDAVSKNLDINGYELLRVVYYWGKFWRKGGWYPEYRLRLIRKSATQWGGTNPHEKAIVSGLTKRLNGELWHYTYDDLFDQISTLNKFSSTAALEIKKESKKISRFNIFFRPLTRFIKFYFTKKGYREGLSGLIVAIIEAFSTFLKYSKAWEIEESKKRSL
jgi:glycosyltransferase involved in cell wall biosynthesis